MKAKYIFQVVQDMVMMIILLSLMGFHLWGESIHEWLGIAFLLIVLLHNGLNIHWIRKLAQGEYSAFRIVQVTVNIILALYFVCHYQRVDAFKARITRSADSPFF